VKTSPFTPWGLLKYVGGEPLAKRLHAQALKLLSAGEGGFSTQSGSFFDSMAFALAMTLTRAAEKIERAKDQRYAAKVYDSIETMEEEFGVLPGAGDNIPTRRRALQARKLAPTGPGRAALETSLRTLLGPVYVGIHVTQPTEAQLWPAACGDQPMNLQLPEITRKLITIPFGITIGLNAPQSVFYTAVEPLPDPTTPGNPHTLQVGDYLVVEPEIGACTETVRVDALTAEANLFNADAPFSYFTATFTRGHGTNCWAACGTYPAWTSSQREIVIIVTTESAIDVEVRRQIHELLERQATGVTTWAIVAESSPGQAGPFTLDDGYLGVLDSTPLDLVPPV
jgi:hypothetical protein